MTTSKPFPKKLISFRNLQGGQYGTLDITAREATLVEIALGGAGAARKLIQIAGRKLIHPAG